MTVLMLLIPVVVCALVYFLLRTLVVWSEKYDYPDEHVPLADDDPLTYDRRQAHLSRRRP
jgi:hypothetical protein